MEYEKLAVLCRKMVTEEALLGGQLTPDYLQQAIQEGRAIFIEQNLEIIAFGALWARECSTELGSLWVATEHRGKKLASKVFGRLVGHVTNRPPLFLITHVPQVIHLAQKCGMCESNRENWTKIVPWSASCGPCDRFSEVDKVQCSFRAVEGECRLFYKN